MVEAVYVVLVVAILVMVFAAYMGIFNKLAVNEDKFPGGYFVYYDYQGHINSVNLFHKNLQKSLEIDTSKLPQMTIAYDDPFNLLDPRSYRASLGFLLTEYDGQLIEKFKKMHYEWRSLPPVKAITGQFPYRNSASLAFGATRFLPACLTYIFRNQKRLKGAFDIKSGTIEVIENGMIKYYLVMEK